MTENAHHRRISGESGISMRAALQGWRQQDSKRTGDTRRPSSRWVMKCRSSPPSRSNRRFHHKVDTSPHRSPVVVLDLGMSQPVLDPQPVGNRDRRHSTAHAPAEVCLSNAAGWLMVRETPLQLGPFAQTQGTECAIVMPPVPAFYAQPRTIEDIVDHSVGRVLDLFGIESDLVRRWQSPAPDADLARS